MTASPVEVSLKNSLEFLLVITVEAIVCRESISSILEALIALEDPYGAVVFVASAEAAVAAPSCESTFGSTAAVFCTDIPSGVAPGESVVNQW